MPLIIIVPAANSERTIQFVATDSSDILLTMERAGCRKADLYRDGEYFMTASQAETAVWSLYCRMDGPSPAEQLENLQPISG